MTSVFFHWPDHVIGKRQSRRIREQHNALANSHAELLEALKALADAYDDMATASGRLMKAPPYNGARAAIAKATAA